MLLNRYLFYLFSILQKDLPNLLLRMTVKLKPRTAATSVVVYKWQDLFCCYQLYYT